MKKIDLIEQEFTKKEIPDFGIGDTVKVYVKILEGDKVRLHPFEGIVLSRHGKGVRSTFTVRKVSFGEGIERVFPIYSASVEKIEVVRKGKSKRAKLYYLRKRVGKEARIKSQETEDKA